jgi:hypothetical protein
MAGDTWTRSVTKDQVEGDRKRLQHQPGTSSSTVVCDFFEVAILEITIRFLKNLWEILPKQPTIQTRKKKLAAPPFPKDENIFQKSARVVL